MGKFVSNRRFITCQKLSQQPKWKLYYYIGKMKKIWIFDSNLLISVVDCLFKIFTLLTLRIESEKCCKRKTSLSWSFFFKLHSLIFRRVIQSHKTSQIFCSHPPLESPGHHATEQLQFVHLGAPPRNRGTAPFDEGLVLARSTTACSTAKGGR